MSMYETVVTPATYAASDDDMAMSSGEARHRRRLDIGLRKRSSSLHRRLASKAPLRSASFSSKVEVGERKPKARNVIERVIHKIKKKRHSSSTPAATSAADPAPPKLDELGIDPRLLEKWMARKELKKQVAAGGGDPAAAASRGTAALVLVGLSSGSLAWTKDRIRSWSQVTGIMVAIWVLVAAVVIACALILRRCS